MVEGEIFTVDRREGTTRVICEGPEHGEKVVDLIWPADWTQPWWGWGVREDADQEIKKKW